MLCWQRKLLHDICNSDAFVQGFSLAWIPREQKCSRDTYPESYIIKYTSIRRSSSSSSLLSLQVLEGPRRSPRIGRRRAGQTRPSRRVTPPAVPGFAFRGWGFEFRGESFGTRDSGFEIQESGFGFRDSGFGIRDLKSGFRVSGSRLPWHVFVAAGRMGEGCGTNC